jgi:hypothetical protein
MLNYEFKLASFQNVYWSEEEEEARFKACLDDASKGFEGAVVTLDGDILKISVSSESELSQEECLKRFKDILIGGGLSLFAKPLF